MKRFIRPILCAAAIGLATMPLQALTQTATILASASVMQPIKTITDARIVISPKSHW